MSQQEMIMAQFLKWMGACGALKVAKDLKKDYKSVDAIVPDVGDGTSSCGTFLLGVHVRRFFKEYLERNLENLEPEAQEMCQKFINNWILPVNLALMEVSETSGKAKK